MEQLILLRFFTIVQTTRANGLKSEQYLAYGINNINKKRY